MNCTSNSDKPPGSITECGLSDDTLEFISSMALKHAELLEKLEVAYLANDVLGVMELVRQICGIEREIKLLPDARKS